MKFGLEFLSDDDIPLLMKLRDGFIDLRVVKSELSELDITYLIDDAKIKFPEYRLGEMWIQCLLISCWTTTNVQK